MKACEKPEPSYIEPFLVSWQACIVYAVYYICCKKYIQTWDLQIPELMFIFWHQNPTCETIGCPKPPLQCDRPVAPCSSSYIQINGNRPCFGAATTSVAKAFRRPVGDQAPSPYNGYLNHAYIYCIYIHTVCVYNICIHVRQRKRDHTELFINIYIYIYINIIYIIKYKYIYI